MEKEMRAADILNQISAFSKESYTKDEYLPELLKLQKEIVNLTFSDDHAEKAKLRLWDVEKHLQNLNEERGKVADKEYEVFVKESAIVKNAISAETSGKKGEKIVFSVLEKLQCNNIVLKNVELESDGKRTEIDAVVFTRRAVFIIEIKNSKKNIFIDEKGDLFRNGYSMHYDCNIAEKMKVREEMLRKALESTGVEHIKIYHILTFTNPRIDVENKYYRIKVCGSNYLSTFIDNFRSDYWYSDETVGIMLTAVEDAMNKKPFMFSVNYDSFKSSFANLMAALESVDEADNKEYTDSAKLEQPMIKPDRRKGNSGTKNNKALTISKYIAATLIGIIGIQIIIKKRR